MLAIRETTIKDIPLIRELVYKVWPQTYESILDQGQINYMLDLMYSESSLRKQMEEGSHFLVVYEDDKAVGFASFQETSPALFKLHKLYVLPSQQGKGTGKFLVNRIIEIVRKAGGIKIQLQVNRANKARYFYEKLGFEIEGSYDFEIGKGYLMRDYVMEKKI